MFGNIQGLVNPAAIAVTKANAFQAAKVVLGLNAATATCLQIAEKYTAWVLPQTNRALTMQQILGDVNFARFVEEVQNGTPAKTVDKVDKLLGGGGYGLSDSLLFGIPNWVLYGGAGYFAYTYYKKRGGIGFKMPAVPSATPAATGGVV